MTIKKEHNAPGYKFGFYKRIKMYLAMFLNHIAKTHFPIHLTFQMPLQ